MLNQSAISPSCDWIFRIEFVFYHVSILFWLSLVLFSRSTNLFIYLFIYFISSILSSILFIYLFIVKIWFHSISSSPVFAITLFSHIQSINTHAHASFVYNKNLNTLCLIIAIDKVVNGEYICFPIFWSSALLFIYYCGYTLWDCKTNDHSFLCG